MAGEEDERGRQFEDAFDDLERYFSSGDRVGRAEDRETPSSGGGTGGGRMGGPAPDRTEPGLEEDLLPPDWAPDVGSLHLDEEEQPPRPTPPPPAPPPDRPSVDRGAEEEEEEEPIEPEVEAALPEEPSEDETAEDETAVWRGEPGEMGGDDWRRVRDVLGEEEADEPVDLTPGPADSPEEGHELTLDDLKKAPPEYRDLPGVYEATVAPEGGEPEAAAPPEAEEEVVAPEPDWDEPDIAEVEAAADQLAYEFRDASEPEEVEKDLLADLDRPGGPRTVRVGPEGLTGPTWEEPTSRVVMAEPVTPSEGPRDMPAALLTAAVLAAAALISLAVSKAAFAVVAGLVVLLGQAELYGAMSKRGHQPATALGLVVGGLVLAGAYLKGEAAMLFFVALGLVLSFLWYMAATPKSREGAIGNIGTTILGIVYVPFLAGYMLVILSQPNSGRALMLAVLGLTFLFDVVAYGVGSLYGARALAPTISPKKSWEGLLGAAVVTFAVAIAGLASIDPIDTWGRAAGLWLLVVVFAPLGDLAESAIKRDLGVKDMGSVLPGHGGILDRIDSVLFVAPAAFYFMRLVF
jgi:phosphatidate cytidylyltransferase